MNPLKLPCRAHYTKYNRYGNINPLSIAYAMRLGLGPTNPWDDYHRPGNLALSADRILTCLEVTHSSILTSSRSTELYSSASLQRGTLLYHSPIFKQLSGYPVSLRLI